VRFELVAVADANAAAAALDTQKAELAVLRSDDITRGSQQTVLILRREAVVIVAPKGGKLQKTSDFANATFGMVRENPNDSRLIDPVLDYYRLDKSRFKTVSLREGEIAPALQAKRVDAVVVIGPTSSKNVTEAISEAARGVRGPLQFIDIEEADAIARRTPAFELIEIEQGAFGGRPPRPSESVNTIGYSVRLVTSESANTETIAELARALLNIRQNLNSVLPGANLMEAPDTDEISTLVVHPGVKAFVNGDQKTFMDRYSDWIFIGMFVGSGLGSLAASMMSWFGQRHRVDAASSVLRLDRLLDAVREARSQRELDALEREVEDVVRTTIAHVAQGNLSESGVAAFGLAVTEARARIAAQRQVLKESAAVTAPLQPPQQQAQSQSQVQPQLQALPQPQIIP
jgi:TRAP-type uncharacterized transport system substrate-binding protein